MRAQTEARMCYGYVLLCTLLLLSFAHAYSNGCVPAWTLHLGMCSL